MESSPILIEKPLKTHLGSIYFKKWTPKLLCNLIKLLAPNDAYPASHGVRLNFLMMQHILWPIMATFVQPCVGFFPPPLAQ
jgi:hypothetical protein